ncbi:hypothetical protein PAHAL_7G237500 [Panicum hallii]|uniref:Uncharacterized protein n=1 Tax=Panicum hallii TaxID=206008 RepID=A0A2T8ID98_9POAL|nr:hypothetical protein PAHAL_7G237500 [Panicum hallii]
MVAVAHWPAVATARRWPLRRSKPPRPSTQQPARGGHRSLASCWLRAERIRNRTGNSPSTVSGCCRGPQSRATAKSLATTHVTRKWRPGRLAPQEGGPAFRYAFIFPVFLEGCTSRGGNSV